MVRAGTLQNMLFYGQPGIGKTSAARILIAEMDADSFPTDELLAAGIPAFQSKFVPWAAGSLLLAPKVCLIDEVESLPARTQGALRKVIENTPNVAFILTANDWSRVDSAVRSRCKSISFNLWPDDYPEIQRRLRSRYMHELRDDFVMDNDLIEQALSAHFPDMRAVIIELEFTLPRRG
jgi:replication-associated recombination protein RarA